MSIIALDWQRLSLLTFVGIFLTVLGVLSIVYDLSDHQSKALQRAIWVLSSGFLVASLLLAFFLLVVAPQRLAAGVSFREVWRSALVFSVFGFGFQMIFLSPLPKTPPPVFLWSDTIWPMAFSSVLLIAMQVQYYSFFSVVLFTLPVVLVIGMLNGFASAFQWWLLRLPKGRLGGIGGLLIFCAFILVLLPPLFGFSSFPVW